jgi:hypothetical protein
MSFESAVDAETWENESDPQERNDARHSGIAARAFEISRSDDAGSDVDNWLQAERELADPDDEGDHPDDEDE